MYRKFILTTIALVTMTGLLRAEDATLEARTEKMGGLRSRVSAKLTDLGKLLDSRAELNKRYQLEAAKAADVRDQALIDSLNAKSQKFDAFWNEQATKWQTYSQKIQELSTFNQNLSQSYTYISMTDQTWLRAGLDPEVLANTFAALDKRTDELKAAAAKLVADFKKVCEGREQQIKE